MGARFRGSNHCNWCFCLKKAKVYITSRTREECFATAEELSKMGPGQCIALPANLQKYDEVKRLVSELENRENGTPFSLLGFAQLLT